MFILLTQLTHERVVTINIAAHYLLNLKDLERIFNKPKDLICSKRSLIELCGYAKVVFK